MHILHLYKDYYPVLGGIENHIKLLAEGQVQRGHDVTVLVTSQTSETVTETRNGVRVIKAGRLATVASAPLSVQYPLLLRRLHADIVHLHFPYPIAEVANWLVGRAPRTVVTYHSDVVRQQGWLQLYNPLLKHILGRVDRVLATSPRYAETSPYLRTVADRVTIVPLGIELERFVSTEVDAVAAWRRRLTPDDTPLLLFVGKLRYYKGVGILLRAMPLTSDARLAVVGAGPMDVEWRRLATESGAGDRITFTGEVSDAELPALYHAADIFVLPATARSEAFGTVLIEAMAAGLPLVTTDVGTGTSWVNQHGTTGLVVPPHEPETLAGAINILVADTDMRAEMGAAGIERARAEFDVEHMVDRVLAVYGELTAGSP